MLKRNFSLKKYLPTQSRERHVIAWIWNEPNLKPIDHIILGQILVEILVCNMTLAKDT
jgi:hypothetical protein